MSYILLHVLIVDLSTPQRNSFFDWWLPHSYKGIHEKGSLSQLFVCRGIHRYCILCDNISRTLFL